MDVPEQEGGPMSEQRARAQECKNLGNEKFNRNQYKGAIEDYKKGLLHEPDNSDLHANLSAAYIHLEKYIDAEEHAVYAINLRPDFYKGYMRAAKAAHGKGLTKLALKRLTHGLTKVSDPVGVKELTRLKHQYSSFLSLQSNADREIDFDSDRYQSEDEDEEPVSSEYESDNSLNPPPPDPPEPVAKVEPLPLSVSVKHNKAHSKDAGKPKETENPSTPRVALPHSTEGSTVADQKSVDKDPQCDKKVNIQERRPFLELTKDQILKKHIGEFKELLKNGGDAYLGGNYRRAAECYKAAKERVGVRLSDYEIDERQFHVIKYAQCAALINLANYDDIVKAIQELMSMKTQPLSIPALYIQIARGYYKLNRFKTALEPLEQLQEILDNFPIFPTFTWPGTDETIQETTPSGLKNSIVELNQNCRMSHKPTAVCRFDSCLKTSTHILPSELIYISDPDFTGYVRMVCEEKCHIEFHIPCWKSYKESICGIGKINDKDLLGRMCLTTDCVTSGGAPSILTSIDIIDSDGQVKSTNKLDPKAAFDSKKAKKKKSRLDDKEKEKEKSERTKEKKNKEKKIREVRKPVAVAEEEEEVEPTQVYVDPVKALESRRRSLAKLRALNFGLEDGFWNPTSPFYGRTDEADKASMGIFLDHEGNESEDVKAAKEFLFDYFKQILHKEGPLKQVDVEELWKESADGFCDMTVVLPNLKSTCELLSESTRFCLLEDYICLSDQLDSAYNMVKTEIVEFVNFQMTGNAVAEQCPSSNPQTSGDLPDLTNQASAAACQLMNNPQSPSESECESDDEVSVGESEDFDDNSDCEDTPQVNFIASNPYENPCGALSEDSIVPPQPMEDSKFSLQELLKEMNQVKNSILKTSNKLESNADESGVIKDNSVFQAGSPSSDSYKTALCSSTNSVDLTKTSPTAGDFSEFSVEEEQKEGDDDASGDKEYENNTVHHLGSESVTFDDNSIETVDEFSSEVKEVSVIEAQSSSNSAECNQLSQDTDVEKCNQTSQTETKDSVSQTKESDLYKELQKEVQDLTDQVATLVKASSKMSEEVESKRALCKKMKKDHEEALARMREENRKYTEVHKALQEQMKNEYLKKEATLKREKEELTNIINKMKETNEKLESSNALLKKNFSSLQKDSAKALEGLSTAMSRNKEFETKYKALEKTMKTSLLKSMQIQLYHTKGHWESRIKMLRNRCMEKITELESWFSMFTPKEVESLPSWGSICQNIMQWSEIKTELLEIEANLQVKFKVIEGQIARGEHVEDLSNLVLPSLPQEPAHLSLNKIHKEIMEKQQQDTAELQMKVNQLTKLVANQQLEIEKSKDANQQIHTLMSSLHMMQQPPRMQTPMTTAFGNLAMQYPYPQTMPPQFKHQAVPTIPPNQDPTSSGAEKNEQADVQTLLQESSKHNSFTNKAYGMPTVKDEAAAGVGQVGPSFQMSYNFPPPPSHIIVPPLIPTQVLRRIDPKMSLPPPPIGVAQNLLKASSTLTDKQDTRPPERSSTPQLAKATPSRETTPVRSLSAAPTPEKAKKKKKKTESRDALEIHMAPSVNSTPVNADDFEKDDDTAWSVVGLPKVKHVVASAFPPSDSKLKNKNKLLQKLQHKFPTTSLKDLDETVKLVREQNNGSLSGLPFEEIETRVDRVIQKRRLQKSTTMGLDKFMVAAWGTVKRPEIISKESMQLDECGICYEPMEKEFTTLDCSHEFHTKCLRTWLKERSVCPYCNRFVRMPDEFPAL